MKSKPFLVFLCLFSFVAVSNLRLQAQIMFESIAVPEASGIVGLSDGQDIIVDDDIGVFFLDRKMEAKLRLSAAKFDCLRDLEGVSLSSDKKNVYFLSEDGGIISRSLIEVKNGKFKLNDPEVLGSLRKLNNKKNKGYEGIAIFKIDNKDHLLAVHQEKPRALAIYSLPELKLTTMCKLPADLKQLLDNLSDVFVDADNGNILLLSGKSGRIVEVKAKIKKDIEELEIIQVINIKGAFNGRPEGICLNNRGQIVVVTDGSGRPSTYMILKRNDMLYPVK
ncbi:MAG: SdiA-regulated domain-containing protein [Candidatus Rifleibacteriota bacterium]